MLQKPELKEGNKQQTSFLVKCDLVRASEYETNCMGVGFISTVHYGRCTSQRPESYVNRCVEIRGLQRIFHY